MREIKFRAWDIGQEMLDHENLMSQRYSKYDDDNISNDTSHKIMQYTGLKDKNGKEIYEGDILENKRSGGVFEVLWGVPNESYAGWAVKWKLQDFDIGHINYDLLYFKERMDNCEILGNIHENPELITKEDLSV